MAEEDQPVVRTELGRVVRKLKRPHSPRLDAGAAKHELAHERAVKARARAREEDPSAPAQASRCVCGRIVGQKARELGGLALKRRLQVRTRLVPLSHPYPSAPREGCSSRACRGSPAG